MATWEAVADEGDDATNEAADDVAADEEVDDEEADDEEADDEEAADEEAAEGFGRSVLQLHLSATSPPPAEQGRPSTRGGGGRSGGNGSGSSRSGPRSSGRSGGGSGGGSSGGGGPQPSARTAASRALEEAAALPENHFSPRTAAAVIVAAHLAQDPPTQVRGARLRPAPAAPGAAAAVVGQARLVEVIRVEPVPTRASAEWARQQSGLHT